MKYNELLEKYNLLLSENSRLTEENNRLKTQLGGAGSDSSKNSIAKKTIADDESSESASFLNLNNTSDSTSKVKLFMSLFKGRDDVFAKRWENKKKARDIHRSA